MNSPAVTRHGAQKAKIQTRSMKKQVDEKRNTALIEAKKRGRQKLNNKDCDNVILKDIYQTAMESIGYVRGKTGIIYDERLAEHFCLWDKNYPECPERFTSVMNRVTELNLLDRCLKLIPRTATKDEILAQHTEEQFELLKQACENYTVAELEDLSSRYDAIYIHPKTFYLTLLACGSTIELVENIVAGKCQNGMAIIRPPGHHAMKAEYNGYCFFNNVAIAAKLALDRLNVNRILIVDYDVHHGQGVQRMFYNDPRVLYFSIHRFEHGKFWPNLRESDYDYIGDGNGKGYNFNIPLNKTGMTNADYLAIFQQILIPVAMEFQPELVLISAGYDAAFGCPEFCPDLVIVSAGYDSALGDEKGEMEITPACYAHLVSPLLPLANGKVAVVLEGGYCLNSLAEGAAITLKTLLGDPCPLMEPLESPSDSIQESILNCIYVHKPYWHCLQMQDTYSLEDLNNINPQPNLHIVSEIFIGGPPIPEKYKTRDCYPLQNDEFLISVEKRLNHLKMSTKLSFPVNRTCFVYDEIMLEHQNCFEESYPERPNRILEIYQRFTEYSLLSRMKLIPGREATIDELCLAHSFQHVDFIRKAVEKEQLKDISDTFNSIYLHKSSFKCASYAAGSILNVVDEVLTGKSRNGVCIIRPPGHHAESDKPHGFCIFNNVAIAAQYAIREHGLKRVLIVDWDIHHGNGIQHIFEKDPNVLYISLHRYDHGTFFPSTTDADYTVVGDGKGKGYNVNIPWNKRTMGDMEYVSAFHNIVLPIAYEYNPELVLVSAGFDAAIGDPLGGYKVTPEAYGYFTHWLSSLANGRIIVCLEGGYNTSSISYAMTMCTKALLGDPLPSLEYSNKSGLNTSSIETIKNVLSVQQKYWKSLKFNNKLPDFSNDRNKKSKVSCDFATSLMEQLTLSSNIPCDADAKENDSSPIDQSNVGGNNQQPGPSKPTEKTQTLVDYLAEHAQALKNEEMFAVVPLKSCPHLSSLKLNNIPNTIDTKQPCENCESTLENWICLECFKIYCGRYIMEHMLFHHIESDHPLTLSFSDLSVWCYKCEAYVDNPILFKFKNLAHIDKFGEELAWSYGNESICLETKF